MEHQHNNIPPSPKDFMKKRRPYRFSDSKIITVSRLNRIRLDYILDTLGERKQEQDFEEFSRKLCQYEICPNLRPQTGSTGGGDSKVDSSTIPVSSQIRISFFQGQDNQNTELLAFAFSTQKDWSGKIRIDVEKIYKTGKAYAKVYCVSSRFAKDNTRSNLETELSKKYGFQVIILDKNWILDKVFGNKREKLAIEELKLGEGLEEKKEIGHLDYQRKKQFEKINTSIEEDVNKNYITIKTAEDCLNAAIIAAELEEPRQEVEGLFERAIRFSKKYGTTDQYFTALYKRAWITYFWFEDFERFLKLYDEVEVLALNSSNIFSVERLNNLLNLISTLASTSDMITREFLEEKIYNLRRKLNEFKDNEANLSASVHAETMLCFENLLIYQNDPVEVASTFLKLKNLINKAKNLIGFPFESTFQVLNEIGNKFCGENTYEELLEYLVEVVTTREGEISAGDLLLNRGMQLLKTGRIYKSIACLGRALRLFCKKESNDRLVNALYFLSKAYEDAGLLWSARGSLLWATSVATSDFWIYSNINTMQLACCIRLKFIELQLGRIGYALEWHQLHLSFALQLANTDNERAKLLDESLYFGSVMGLLLVKTPDKELKILEKLPDTLMTMDLDFSAYGLIYRLGGMDLLPMPFLDKIKPEEIEDFFNSWLKQPAQESLPDTPAYYIDDTIELKSRILGCEYIVSSPNSSPEIEIGEYVFSALESFLSTTIEMSAVSRDSSAIITILRDDTLKEEINYETMIAGKFGIIVKCSAFNPHSLSKVQQEKISSSISDLVLDLIANTILFKDPAIDLLKLFKDEEVSSRAFNFSTPMVTLGNVLGYNPKRSILDWINPEATSYTYIPEKSGKLTGTKNFIKGDNVKAQDAPLRHSEIKNVSVIRQHLWDKAGWTGVLYITSVAHPPVLAFLFKNEENAKAIFKDWKETLGNKDIKETIRISIIRGVSEDNPTWYRVVITTNLHQTENSFSCNFVVVSRIHTLTPDNTTNLDRFSESFKKFGIYLLAPAIIDDNKQPPRVLFEIGIEKQTFNDRQAWEIGLNDLDCAGITNETTPIIPKDIKNAPVLELLKRMDNL
ncbi:MAG: hypothetical protein A2475_03940 [Ignavibacteria bacterium RIFOXYC2_FULL_35_21]|nr:MAG: hypothetical protein A2220_03025 [Ignavibacteria bacterium RIFOXYA2_FULL_35_10]OGV21714.1 MAG: hypothetical protein A2475_03940 [Ignavibacteria bacterium RIFOXYC2_FULL_35_21]